MVPDLIFNTSSLLIVSLVLGIGIALPLAYILELTDIPFKKVWNVLALLPLSIPMYILAYIYVGATEWSSPLMSFIRNHISTDLGNLNNKNVFVVSFVFALGLYPYIYIPIRRKLKKLSGEYYITGLILKKSHLKVFTGLLLPQLLYVTLVGASLFAMEVLADFGAVSAFNFDTFTTAIYTAWSGLYSYQIACRLSLMLLVFSFLFFYLEGKFGNEAASKRVHQTFAPIKLSKVMKFISLTFVSLLSLFSFVLPLVQLISWLLKAVKESKVSFDTIYLLKNTFIIAASVGVIAIIICVIYIFIERHREKYSNGLKFSLLGYAIPGNIIAIAVFWLTHAIKNVLNINIGLIVLFYGLVYRFLALPMKHLQVESKKIPVEFEYVSRSLKRSTTEFFFKVWTPKMKMGMLYAFVLMILESAKEMPMTLMLRPIGFDTLSTKVFELTSEGEWERASLHATVLILMGMISTMIIFRGEKNA